jgi:hypothetical protein
MTKEYFQWTHRVATDYRTYLAQRFQGEVFGQAMFRTMADLCDDPARAQKFRVLEQLERETKEFLLPAMREAGHSCAESRERINEGERLGAALTSVPWAELMHGFQKEFRQFADEFETAEALAPAGKESVLRHVTTHERALLDFATRELEGSRVGDSLQSVVALLRTSRAA